MEDRLEQLVLGHQRRDGGVVGDAALERLLQLDGVLAQAVDADAREMVVGVDSGEELGLMMSARFARCSISAKP